MRGDLLLKLGRAREAQAEFERASELARNERERELTAQRARSAAQSLALTPSRPDAESP
ncbi:MAG TPA: hypothetical protein VFQ44_09375 [Streptosporangiaceae bacterium]|nr:hypothetical protein [Streptosporangiaceae bacterium]